MIVRRTSTFRGRDGFTQVAIFENDEGEFFIVVREATSLDQLLQTRPHSARYTDMFAGYDAATRAFERRCSELQRRGWKIARAA